VVVIKVSGIKRHIAVDSQGLPHAIAATTADVTGQKGALAARDIVSSNATCRFLWKNCGHKPSIGLHFVHLAFLGLTA